MILQPLVKILLLVKKIIQQIYNKGEDNRTQHNIQTNKAKSITLPSKPPISASRKNTSTKRVSKEEIATSDLSSAKKIKQIDKPSFQPPSPSKSISPTAQSPPSSQPLSPSKSTSPTAQSPPSSQPLSPSKSVSPTAQSPSEPSSQAPPEISSSTTQSPKAKLTQDKKFSPPEISSSPISQSPPSSPPEAKQTQDKKPSPPEISSPTTQSPPSPPPKVKQTMLKNKSPIILRDTEIIITETFEKILIEDTESKERILVYRHDPYPRPRLSERSNPVYVLMNDGQIAKLYKDPFKIFNYIDKENKIRDIPPPSRMQQDQPIQNEQAEFRVAVEIENDDQDKSYVVEIDDNEDDSYDLITTGEPSEFKLGTKREYFILTSTVETSMDIFSTLCIYSSITTLKTLGNTQAPLLRLVNVDKKHSEVQHLYFGQDRQYSKLANYNFNTIRVEITDTHGKNIPFAASGEIILGLHFKPIKNL